MTVLDKKLLLYRSQFFLIKEVITLNNTYKSTCMQNTHDIYVKLITFKKATTKYTIMIQKSLHNINTKTISVKFKLPSPECIYAYIKSIYITNYTVYI